MNVVVNGQLFVVTSEAQIAALVAAIRTIAALRAA